MSLYTEPQQSAVAIIETLRSGIPTRISTRALPDLRSYLSEKIHEDLKRFQAGEVPPGRLVWGQYGQGKTHMLTTVEHMALDMGFAVSRLTLSREVSCHQIFPFYGQLAASLLTPNSVVMGLHKRLAERSARDFQKSVLATPGRYIHPLPQQIAEDFFHAEGEDQALLYGDLTGTRLPLKELRRIHKSARQSALPAFSESFKQLIHTPAYFAVMADLVQFCGYKGWVLLVDEIELLGRLGKLSRMRAYLNLSWLLNGAQNLNFPVYLLGAVATRLQDDTWYGGQGGARKKPDDRTVMPELAGEKFGKEAQDTLTHFFRQAISKDSPIMRPVHENELSALLEELIQLHGQAYQWAAQLDISELLHYLGSQPVRTYIRAALEALDRQYLYGHTEKLAASALVEHALHEDESFFNSEQTNE